MEKKKGITCIILLAMLIAFFSIFYYALSINNKEVEKKGTFVKAFSQKVNESCI